MGRRPDCDWANIGHWTKCVTVLFSTRKQQQPPVTASFFLIAFLEEAFIRNIIIILYINYIIIICINNNNNHHKHQVLDPLIRSVSRATAARANASSVFQLFSFLVVCSSMISKGNNKNNNNNNNSVINNNRGRFQDLTLLFQTPMGSCPRKGSPAFL